MKMIKYDNISDPGDFLLLLDIAVRYAKVVGCDLTTANADVLAVHANCGGLKLKEFLEADDFNFAHDATGIHHHLNRETIELENCFLPRFSNNN